MRAEYKARFEENFKYAEYYSQQSAVFEVINDLAQLFRQGYAELGGDSLDRAENNPDYLRTICGDWVSCTSGRDLIGLK